nr:hypothetical protein [Tanacetum cinerariifolium]
MPLLFAVLAFYRTRVAGLCWGMMVEVMGSSGSGGEEAGNVGEVVAEMAGKYAFWGVYNQFQKFIDSHVTLDYDSQMTEKYFAEYTGIK